MIYSIDSIEMIDIGRHMSSPRIGVDNACTGIHGTIKRAGVVRSIGLFLQNGRRRMLRLAVALLN